MIKYEEILRRHYPELSFTITDEVYEGLVIISDHPKPTKKELDDLWPATKKAIDDEINAKKASRKALLDKLGITQEEAQLLLS